MNYTIDKIAKIYFYSSSFADGSSADTYASVDEDLKEGCFIATAAYGSYFQEDVKVLRDFRDTVLLQTFLGQKIVSTYYEYSPYIADKIANSELARSSVRVLLTPIVYAVKYPYGLLFILFILLLFVKRNSFKKETKI
jgi:hypothetical protein